MLNKSAKSSSPAPLKAWKRRGIHVSVWRNTSEKDGSTYLKTSVARVYKDKDTGEFKSVASFGANEIALLQLLLAKAFDFVTETEAEASKIEEQPQE